MKRIVEVHNIAKHLDQAARVSQLWEAAVTDQDNLRGIHVNLKVTKDNTITGYTIAPEVVRTDLGITEEIRGTYGSQRRFSAVSTNLLPDEESISLGSSYQTLTRFIGIRGPQNDPEHTWYVASEGTTTTNVHENEITYSGLDVSIDHQPGPNLTAASVENEYAITQKKLKELDGMESFRELAVIHLGIMEAALEVVANADNIVLDKDGFAEVTIDMPGFRKIKRARRLQELSTQSAPVAA